MAIQSYTDNLWIKVWSRGLHALRRPIKIAGSPLVLLFHCQLWHILNNWQLFCQISHCEIFVVHAALGLTLYLTLTEPECGFSTSGCLRRRWRSSFSSEATCFRGAEQVLASQIQVLKSKALFHLQLKGRLSNRPMFFAEDTAKFYINGLFFVGG